MIDTATEKLLRVLGVDVSGKNITRVQVDMEAGRAPVVTVHRVLYSPGMVNACESFALVSLDPEQQPAPPEPPPFDIDAAR